MTATGGITSGQVRIAKNGHVFMAPVGSAAPTDVTTALSSAWNDVGYIDEDGVTISPDVSTTPIKKWQSTLPVKYTLDEISLSVNFMMNQYNRANSALYFFGAQWVNQAAGVTKLTVSSSPLITDLERAVVVEFTDDSNAINRLYFPRGMVVERNEMKLTRTSDIKMGITYHVMDNSGEMFEIFSNNADLYSI